MLVGSWAPQTSCWSWKELSESWGTGGEEGIGVTVEQVLEPSYFTLVSRLQFLLLLGLRSFVVCNGAWASSNLLCGLWGNVTYVPWTVWINCNSPKVILPCGSTWQVECWILWLSSARYPLTFFNAFSAFSCTWLGKVAFLRIGLLVAVFSTSDSSLGLAEVLQRLEVSAGCVLQPGPDRWEALGHLSRGVVRSCGWPSAWLLSAGDGCCFLAGFLPARGSGDSRK